MMAGEKKIDSLDLTTIVEERTTPADSANQDMGSGKDVISSDSTSISSGNAKSNNKSRAVKEHGVYYPPASCYNYYYQGYPPPVSYGAEGLPCYSWDSTFVRETGYGSMDGVKGKNADGRLVASAKNNGVNYTKTNGNTGSKPFKSSSNSQPLKPFNKVPQNYSDFSVGVMNGFYPAGKFPSYTNQGQGPFWQYNQINYRANGRTWNENNKYKAGYKYNRNGGFEASAELTRGPRTYRTPSDPSVEKNDLILTLRKDQCNLPEFQTDYEDARFYVIKSYSEDDVHKGIKYSVWTSTPNGNKKLNAVFHEAERKSSESGKTCPIFLFFSVNGSGQFVGCAEMIAQVDFNKHMDFWQQDKWLGFFPVKWHIIKDVPNAQLRHIILENNENRPVTFSRDTQEIGLKQGLELLKIFKSYSSKTSLLDDFHFYENREKSHEVKETCKATPTQTGVYENVDLPFSPLHIESKSEPESAEVKIAPDAASLVSLTENLSLDVGSFNGTAAELPNEDPVPSAALAS